MISRLPAGWLGLVAASLVAAYMSTIATHLNWGSSYLVQDFYVRFVNPKADPKKQVLMGRIFMLVLLFGCAGMALVLQNAKGGFDLMLQVGAGTGLIYILRWFWHRLNAWSEISAMVISFLVACFFQWGAPACGLESWLTSGWRATWLTLGAWKLVLGVVVTTIGWLAVTFATPKEPKETLDAFDKLIHADLRELPMGVLCMVFGCLAVWTCLFGCGYLVYAAGGVGCWCVGVGLLAVSVVSTVVLMKLVGRTRLS
jgi:Na+/proline symporter